MSTSSRIAKNTFFLYVRMLIVMAASLLSVRILLMALGAEDYGIYGVAAASVTLLAFMNGAMANASQRFLAIDIGRGEASSLNRTFNTSLVIHAGGALILVILAETIGLWFLNHKLNIPAQRLESANVVYHFSIAASVLNFIQAPFSALIIAREKMWFFSLVSFLEAGLKLGVAYLVLHAAGDRLTLYSGLFFVALLVVFSAYTGFCFRKFKETKLHWAPDIDAYRKQLSFIGWQFFGNAAASVRMQGTNILLNLFFGPMANAAFGVMTQVQSAVSAFANSFQQALSPQIYKTYAKGEIQRMHDLVTRGSKFSFMLLLLLVVPALYGMDYVLKLWLLDVPEYASAFVKGILIILLLESASLPLINAAGATGKIKWYQIVLGGLLLLNIPLCYLAFKLWHVPTAFIHVSIGLSIVVACARLWFLRHLIGFSILRFYREVVLRLLVIGIATWLLLFGVQKSIGVADSMQKLVLGVAFTLLCVSMICFLIGMDKNERNLFFKAIRQGLRK